MIPFKKSAVESEAKFSEDEKHRYFLKKVWNPEGDIATVIMLNPTKKADAIRFDKSVMLMNNYFAEQIINEQPVYGGFIVVNLFSYRSKNEEVMKEETGYNERFDEKTDEWISRAVKQSKDVYIAWGSNKNRQRRINTVKNILKKHDIIEVYRLDSNNHPSKGSGDFKFKKIKVSEI